MMRKKLFGRRDDAAKPIVVVSGLPRSGTSLMMKMLEAGGIPPMTDGIRAADKDNPKGYYELERAKKLSSGDAGWLGEARGRAVKIIATLLYDLPDEHRYRVVFMRRNMSEILASQRQMLVNRGEDPDLVSDADMSRMFEGHLRRLESWMAARSDIEVFDVDYNLLVSGGAIDLVEGIDTFLGPGLDTQSMIAAIDPLLYRQREEG